MLGLPQPICPSLGKVDRGPVITEHLHLDARDTGPGHNLLGDMIYTPRRHLHHAPALTVAHLQSQIASTGRAHLPHPVTSQNHSLRDIRTCLAT